MGTIHPFLHLLAQAPRAQVIGLFALMVLSSVTDGVGILLLVPLLDTLGGGGSGTPLVRELMQGLSVIGLPPTTEGLLGAFILLVGVRSFVQLAREQLGVRVQCRIVDQLRLKCFAALLDVEWRWLVTTRRSDHANLLLSNISRIGAGLNVGISLVATVAAMIAYLGVAFILSPRMTLLALLSGAIVFWALSGLRRQALDLGHRQTKSSRDLHGNVQESLEGIKLSKILGSERRHIELFIRAIGRLRQQQLKFALNASLSRAIFFFGGAVLLVAYLYAGLSLWHVPVPELLTLVLIFSRLVPMFMAGQQQLHNWAHAMPALQETEQLLDQCRAAAEPREPTDNGAWPIRDGIVLDGVSLTYAGRDVAALSNVSLRFQARTTTAVMGASGSGKSTLADLLMGLLAPDAGTMAVDGVPVSGGNRKSWRNNVAYVPQETFLFHDSIRENLLWGSPEATEQELKVALERAAADFVFALPQGLETFVGDGGVRLSGGERQRLALARALLGAPRLLILDEATSALDIDNEAKVRDAIEHLHGDLTVVIIGHRLPTLEHADQVIVLEGGRVAAQGTWPEARATLGRVE